MQGSLETETAGDFFQLLRRFCGVPWAGGACQGGCVWAQPRARGQEIRVCKVLSGNGCNVQIPAERPGQASLCSSPTVLHELKGWERPKEHLRGKSGGSQCP